ncbi:MAG: hypothetical protein SGI83_06370 [Bacteroidota bacterium]|nr:hypothetical protein [Bacteroidota bacterium]
MDRKTLTIVLAVALIASFFLPILSYGGKGASGLDIVTAKVGDWQKYLFLVFPLCGLLLLLGELNNNYVVPRSLLTWLPLLAILYFLILGPIINGAKLEYVFKYIGKGYGAGLWIAIVASLILAFYNPKPR